MMEKVVTFDDGGIERFAELTGDTNHDAKSMIAQGQRPLVHGIYTLSCGISTVLDGYESIRAIQAHFGRIVRSGDLITFKPMEEEGGVWLAGYDGETDVLNDGRGTRLSYITPDDVISGIVEFVERADPENSEQFAQLCNLNDVWAERLYPVALTSKVFIERGREINSSAELLQRLLNRKGTIAAYTELNVYFHNDVGPCNEYKYRLDCVRNGGYNLMVECFGKGELIFSGRYVIRPVKLSMLLDEPDQ